MKCPNCNAEINKETINIQTDIAQCSACNTLFKISESFNKPIDAFDINTPPKGTWLRKEMHTIVIGASTRSPIAFFLVPFMLVWSGGSMGGIYGTQIMSGEFNIIMTLFGIPFILGSIIFWSIALMAIWGKVELTIDKSGGKIFTGLGNIGYTQRFGWEEITSVIEKQKSFASNYEGIQLEGKRRITFGIGLRSSRRYYLYKALQIIIQKIKTNNSLI